jgi:hypothetical protein
MVPPWREPGETSQGGFLCPARGVDRPSRTRSGDDPPPDPTAAHDIRGIWRHSGLDCEDPGSVFRINLWQGFLYPLSSLKRLAAAWLILPLSLTVLVPPILLGLGVLSTVSMSLQQGLGFGLLVGLVCVTVGALPFTFLSGYMLRCRKEVISGNGSELPPWNRWGDLLAGGGHMDTLALIFALPPLVLFWFALSAVGMSLKNLYDHVSWGSALWALLGSGAGLGLLACAVVVWLVAMMFSPIASLRVALGHSALSAVSPLGMMRDIRRGLGDYLLCCAVVWGIGILFSMAQTGFWPLIVVNFPVQVTLQLVWAHLLGQYARAYLGDNLGEGSDPV